MRAPLEEMLNQFKQVQVLEEELKKSTEKVKVFFFFLPWLNYFLVKFTGLKPFTA